MWHTVGMEPTWRTWTLTIGSAVVATLLATGNGQVLIDLIASTGIVTADGLTWLLAQGAPRG
jgi:hypothetical protein